MHHNWRDLVTTILPPGLIFILAVITGILSKTLLIENSSEDNTQQNLIQMSGVEIVHNKFEETRHYLNTITADRVQYSGNEIIFFNPMLTSYTEDQDRIKISAAQAITNSEMDLVNLFGTAQIRKIDDQGKTRFVIDSEQLIFNVKDKIVATEKAVELEQNRIKISGQGMVFNQELGILKIKENAKLRSENNSER